MRLPATEVGEPELEKQLFAQETPRASILKFLHALSSNNRSASYTPTASRGSHLTGLLRPLAPPLLS